MTTPRFVVPGQFYLLSRRCASRQFFLRPDSLTSRIFLYCLAEAAARFGIRLVVWIAMGNHYHAVIEDRRGALPEFLCHFHKMTARCLNARWGRWENLWAAEQASAVRLVELADVLDKAVYSLTNPVVADLVDTALDWPGASSAAALDGRRIEIARPGCFFAKDGVMPATVTLQAEHPTGWPGGAVAWAAAVRDGVAAREKAARLRRMAAGRRIVGRRSVREGSPTSRPGSVEPRRGLRPQLACGNPSRRATELVALGAFRAAYRVARELFIAGIETVFPYGTYKFVQEYNLASLPAPS